MISEYERAQIAQAIAEVERHTDAELVTVLTARSDDYRYLPVLWAAACALLMFRAARVDPVVDLRCSCRFSSASSAC